MGSQPTGENVLGVGDGLPADGREELYGVFLDGRPDEVFLALHRLELFLAVADQLDRAPVLHRHARHHAVRLPITHAVIGTLLAWLRAVVRVDTCTTQLWRCVNANKVVPCCRCDRQRNAGCSAGEPCALATVRHRTRAWAGRKYASLPANNTHMS